MWEEIRTSKDPTVFTVLFEDSAALAGLIVALVGIYPGHTFEMPVLDGVASIVIGVILCRVASLLLYESRGLLLGESARPEVRARIRRIAEEDPAVAAFVRSMSMHMGPHEVLLALELEFRPELSTEEVEEAVNRIERSIRAAQEEVKYIFIEAESIGRRRAQKAEDRG